MLMRLLAILLGFGIIARAAHHWVMGRFDFPLLRGTFRLIFYRDSTPVAFYGLTLVEGALGVWLVLAMVWDQIYRADDRDGL
jgi:hypothetical protein